MAVIATAISFFVIILAVAVSSGFRQEIRDGLSYMAGDIRLDDDPYVNADSTLIASIKGTSGVKDAVPVIYRAGIVKNGTDIQGVMVKGIPGRDSSLSVSIPSRLSRELGLKAGDPMLTYFVEERLKVRKFIVESVYECPVETEESMIVFAPIEDIRRLNGWEGEEASAIEVTLNDSGKDAADEVAYILGAKTSLYPNTIRSEYPQLFGWLDLLDFNVVVLLILMTVVAGFNMISGLYILLFRNVSTIGILKTLGMTDRAISEVFLRVAARIVAIGMAAGNALALVFCIVQNSTHIIKLNPENYFLSSVPAKIDLPFILAADAASFCAIMLLLLIPTLFIAKVDPAQTAKSE